MSRLRNNCINLKVIRGRMPALPRFPFVDFKRTLPIESRTFRQIAQIFCRRIESMKSKSIGILTKPKFPEVKETLQAVVGWLRARSIDVILDTTSAALLDEKGGIQKNQLAGKADVLLVLGGDGTMLNAARLAGERSRQG